MNGSHESIKFTSTPEGAEVYIEGQPKGKTPATINVRRAWDPVKVEFRLDGYQTWSTELTTSLEEVTLVNIIFPIGFAVDYVSDAMHQFDEKEVHAELKKSGN